MRLTPGSHLGPYEILTLLGTGGMGEVYRARDPRLNREVAIKVLPGDRAHDPDRAARFRREAQAIAALNHPHIVTIHEVGSSDGIDFLVMEYVRGTSLDTRIPKHGLPLGESLRIAIAVADALATAHAHAIIHRDLKPANVVVGPDGIVKVLDFGLARLLDDGPADPADVTRTLHALTDPGQRVGTLADMSPEQAAGSAVDARSDIFSFGALLYELVTGTRAFAGKTATETLRAVLDSQPPAPSEVVPQLPPSLDRVIQRCLRKDASRRFQTMADLKVDLLEIKEESDSGKSAAPSLTQRKESLLAGRRGRLLAATAVVVLVGGFIVWKAVHPQQVESATRPPMRVVQLTSVQGVEDEPSFSPDGNAVAFTHGVFGRDQDWVDGNWGIYLTTVDSGESTRVTPDHRKDRLVDGSPVWSPDGLHIAFVRRTPPTSTGAAAEVSIQVMSATGGGIVKVSDFPVCQTLDGCSRVAWSPDSKFLVAARQPGAQDGEDAGIFLVPLGGGLPRRLTTAKSPTIHFSPAFSPDGRSVAYASGTAWNRELYVVPVDSTLTASGPPRRVTGGLATAGVVWSRDGRSLIFASFSARNRTTLYRVDADGQHQPQRLELPGNYANSPALAPVGDRLAFVRYQPDNVDIYRFLPGKPSVPVLASSVVDLNAAISPDTTAIAFSSDRVGDRLEIWLADPDGGNARQLTHGPGGFQGSPTWSPDGRHIAFDSLGDDGLWHIWSIDASGGTPRRLTHGKGENIPSWSSTGDYVYYQGHEESPERSKIWRVPAGGGIAEQLTHDDAYACREWGGRYLVYQTVSGDCGPLLLMPLAGGATKQIVAKAGGLTPGPSEDLYYTGCETQNTTLHLLDPASGRDQILGTLPDFNGDRVSPSRDGKSILFTRAIGNPESDLFMIENFK